MVRRLRSAIGTVEHAATPVSWTLSVASRPRNINPSSSAVDLASVFTRQECTSFSPSKVARTVLVFPMSIHSSTAISLDSGPEVQRDVQDRCGVGQRTDRQVIDASQCVLAGD